MLGFPAAPLWLLEPARLCGDELVTAESSLTSRPLVEKSSFRRTDADVVAIFGSIIEPLVGEETGPRDGFLLAGDCKNVLIGDLERGGGMRILARFRSVRTAVGSGMVPRINVNIGKAGPTAGKTYFRQRPCLPH